MQTSILIPAKITSVLELQYLSLAIKSALHQAPIWVGLNQCAVDTSTLEKSFPEVKFLSLDTKNLPATRNVLAKTVTTKYFLFLDADDMLPEDAVAIAEANHPGLGWYVYGNTLVFSENSQSVHEAQCFNTAKLLTQVYFPNGVLHFTKNLTKSGLWDEKLPMLEDKEFWIRSAREGICGFPINALLYKYRANPAGIVMTKKNSPEWLAATEYINNKHSDLYSGETSMACKTCGGKKKKTATLPVDDLLPSPSRPIASHPGQVTIIYQLKTGSTVFFGPVTGSPYVVSASKSAVLVHESDLFTQSTKKPGLLEMMKYGQPVFRQA